MTIQWGFSFVAGLLTTLSPCVLPILPFLFGSAIRKNKKSPLYMILGLALSFIIVGFSVSRFGSLFGLDTDQIRFSSALILVITSLFFISTKLQDLISERITRFSNLGTLATRKFNLSEESAVGSLLIGSLLGVIWSPCTGPTLGVAVSMASQVDQALIALQIMCLYAFGAAIPMLIIAYGFQSFIKSNINKISIFADNSKKYFGFIMFLTGVFILFNFDKNIETFLLNNLPDIWVDLITRF